MRILMATDYFWPHVTGGVERVALELSTRLVQRGHQVTIVTLQYAGDEPRGSYQGVQVIRVPALALTGVVRLQLSVSGALLARTRALLAEVRPDVVHCHNLYFPSSLWLALAARAARRPVVATLHVGSVRELRGLGGLASRIYTQTAGRLFVRAAQHVVCVSQAVAREALALGAPPARVSVIPNGVDTSRFRPAAGEGDPLPESPTSATPPPDPIVLFVGRLIENKGPRQLLAAAAQVAAGGQPFRLHVVGDGPLRQALESQAAVLGLQERCTFFDATPHVEPHFQSAAVLVRPSLTEGLPMTVLEAMATAVPVVASDVGGSPELVQTGATGILVPPNDVPALAEAIRTLLQDPAQARRMGQAGRQVVQAHYSWDGAAERYEALYQAAAGGLLAAPAGDAATAVQQR